MKRLSNTSKIVSVFVALILVLSVIKPVDAGAATVYGHTGWTINGETTIFSGSGNRNITINATEQLGVRMYSFSGVLLWDSAWSGEWLDYINDYMCYVYPYRHTYWCGYDVRRVAVYTIPVNRTVNYYVTY